MSKERVLIIIPHNMYIRNYIQSDAFNSMEQQFDCFYIGSDQITIRDELALKPNFIGFYKENKKQNRRSHNYFNVLMFKYRNKSSSFQFRIKRVYDMPRGTLLNTVKIIISQASRLRFTLFRKYCEKYKVKFLSSGLFFRLYKQSFEKLYKVNSDLFNAINELKPGIVLFPSSAYDPIGVDIVKSCRTLNIPSLFLIDNWDNLSSKSILFEKPDHLGVWSQQSKEHAIDIQDFTESNIHIIGTPRFDQYFKKRDSYLPSYFDFKYILFVGTAVAFDEAGILERIDQIMEDNRLFEGIKLIYRPHPWRQGRDTIADRNLRHILIDPQLKEAYLKQNSTIAIQPSLDYYPALIKNAEFVMGGLTTMLIETLVFRKSYFALAYDDGKNLTSQHNMYKHYVHFRGLENVEAIHLCTDLKNFSTEFTEHWRDRENVNIKNVDMQREYYLFQDEKYEYKDKLKSVVQKILVQ